MQFMVVLVNPGMCKVVEVASQAPLTVLHPSEP
jgi:hypothetical protein